MAGSAVATTRASSATMKNETEVSASTTGSGLRPEPAPHLPLLPPAPVTLVSSIVPTFRGSASGTSAEPADWPTHLPYGRPGPYSTAAPDFLDFIRPLPRRGGGAVLRGAHRCW